MSRRRLTIIIPLLLIAAACGGGAGRPPAQDQLPQITLDSLRENLNGEWVKVPAADGKSKPLNPWVFSRDEPKEIKILEQKVEGDTGTFLVEIQTRSAPNSKNHYRLSGQLRLHYQLESGLVLREWEIVRIENISFTYVNEQPTPEANSNANANEGNSNSKPKAGSNANGAGDKPEANHNSTARTIAALHGMRPVQSSALRLFSPSRLLHAPA